jgi:prevent-host-death family protein
MPKKIGTYEARTHWSELMQDVKKGERYVITHHGEPVAELIPSQAETRQERSKAAARRLVDGASASFPIYGYWKRRMSRPRRCGRGMLHRRKRVSSSP